MQVKFCRMHPRPSAARRQPRDQEPCSRTCPDGVDVRSAGRNGDRLDESVQRPALRRFLLASNPVLPMPGTAYPFMRKPPPGIRSARRRHASTNITSSPAAESAHLNSPRCNLFERLSPKCAASNMPISSFSRAAKNARTSRRGCLARIWKTAGANYFAGSALTLARLTKRGRPVDLRQLRLALNQRQRIVDEGLRQTPRHRA